MNLNLIIEAIKERCPSFLSDDPNDTPFTSRVAGAAQFAGITESSNMLVPCAFVTPLDDTAGEQESSNAYKQELSDGFAVVLCLDNTADPRGQKAVKTYDELRREIWAALLGWKPSDEYDIVVYEGGSLKHMDRARLYYQLDFSAAFTITKDDTWMNPEHQARAELKEVNINIDVIDPHADPNISKPGPDGRQEFNVQINLSEEDNES